MNYGSNYNHNNRFNPEEVFNSEKYNSQKQQHNISLQGEPSHKLSPDEPKLFSSNVDRYNPDDVFDSERYSYQKEYMNSRGSVPEKDSLNEKKASVSQNSIYNPDDVFDSEKYSYQKNILNMQDNISSNRLSLNESKSAFPQNGPYNPEDVFDIEKYSYQKSVQETQKIARENPDSISSQQLTLNEVKSYGTQNNPYNPEDVFDSEKYHYQKNEYYTRRRVHSAPEIPLLTLRESLGNHGIFLVILGAAATGVLSLLIRTQALFIIATYFIIVGIFILTKMKRGADAVVPVFMFVIGLGLIIFQAVANFRKTMPDNIKTIGLIVFLLLIALMFLYIFVSSYFIKKNRSTNGSGTDIKKNS